METKPFHEVCLGNTCYFPDLKKNKQTKAVIEVFQDFLNQFLP